MFSDSSSTRPNNQKVVMPLFLVSDTLKLPQLHWFYTNIQAATKKSHTIERWVLRLICPFLSTAQLQCYIQSRPEVFYTKQVLLKIGYGSNSRKY